MRLTVSTELDHLAGYVDRFVDLVGRDRWFKRADQLDIDQRKSYFRRKIVSDYHWIEMAISFQAEVFAKEGRLRLELTDELILTALNFAAITVEIHAQLTAKGKKVLEGRLRDAMKSETGFAPLYLEFDLAQRLMDSEFDVQFADIEGVAQFDLIFSRRNFVGEVECKSLSADAGRQIHRKDFYRFMEAIAPSLMTHMDSNRKEILLVSLDSRLPSDTTSQAYITQAVRSILEVDAPRAAHGSGFKLTLHPYSKFLADAPLHNQKKFYKICRTAFGHNIHVAGGVTDDGGCLAVMRSEREDDTSKPMLEAMRKAASQFTGKRPAFIAIQEHGIEKADLMLPNLRRQAAILSYALFGHYGAGHVNATYISGFGAVVTRGKQVGTPAFAIVNPRPTFAVSPADASPFLVHIADEDYATLLGAPLPASNISSFPFE